MKLLENLKRTMESIEDIKKQDMVKEDDDFSALYEKYSDIPKEVLINIINDVKDKCTMIEEDSVDSKQIDILQDVEHTDTSKAESLLRKNELDASEDVEDELIISEEDNLDDVEQEEIQEDEEDIEDELIISEEDNLDDVEQEEIQEDEDFDVYKDELDVVDSEEMDEDAEDLDMNIPEDDVLIDAADKALNEGAEKIDMNIPEDDVPIDAADKAAREINNGAKHKNEANVGAKAAVANREAKGNFSADVDALTDYLDEY